MYGFLHKGLYVCFNVFFSMRYMYGFLHKRLYVIFENNLHMYVTEWSVHCGAQTNASRKVAFARVPHYAETLEYIVYIIIVTFVKKHVFIKMIRTWIASYSCEITYVPQYFTCWFAKLCIPRGLHIASTWQPFV